VPWSNWLEPKKEEVTDDVLVVMVQLIKASHNVADPQLFLGVLQQRDECALAAVRQLASGHAHVQSVLPQHRLPCGPCPAQTRRGETNLYGGVRVVVHCLVLDVLTCDGVQSIAHRVRGISVIPRASALWEFPTCAGGIKPAVEAPRPAR